jgi:hypothetical protein
MHEDPWERRGDRAGRDGSGPVGPSRPAQADRPGPVPGSVRDPFPCTRRIFNPKSLEAPPFAEERVIRTERLSTSYREKREAPTSGEYGRHRQKHHHDQWCHV